MKKLLLLGMIWIGFQQAACAQVRLSVDVNIGNQPVWGPVGYDHVEYYYLPDIDAYYYVPRHQFVYLEGKRWIFAASLPARYRGYDLYGGYKVVVNEPRPYLRAAYYRQQYARYRNWHGARQVVIRDSRDDRYRNGWDRGDHGRGNAHDNHPGRGHH
ncbi:MAG TPA: hypothetical protein VG842_02245 [Sediminibacterium sp.]|nr:hypothetical protein [Sediminibacterium sp.]